jgi:hypothetical protein
VHIDISEDEALVLFDLLQAFEASDETTIALRHVAERNALWALTAQLEKQLVAPFKEEYAALLSAARTRVEKHGPPW